MIVIDEYLARVVGGDWPAGLPDSEELALPASPHWRILQRIHAPGSAQICQSGRPSRPQDETACVTRTPSCFRSSTPPDRCSTTLPRWPSATAVAPDRRDARGWPGARAAAVVRGRAQRQGAPGRCCRRLGGHGARRELTQEGNTRKRVTTDAPRTVVTGALALVSGLGACGGRGVAARPAHTIDHPGTEPH